MRENLTRTTPRSTMMLSITQHICWFWEPIVPIFPALGDHPDMRFWCQLPLPSAKTARPAILLDCTQSCREGTQTKLILYLTEKFGSIEDKLALTQLIWISHSYLAGCSDHATKGIGILGHKSDSNQFYTADDKADMFKGVSNNNANSLLPSSLAVGEHRKVQATIYLVNKHVFLYIKLTSSRACTRTTAPFFVVLWKTANRAAVPYLS